MKHDLRDKCPDGVSVIPKAGDDSGLTLHLVSSLSDSGEPQLIGVDRKRVLITRNFGSEIVGAFAVCMPIISGEQPSVAIIGYLSVDQIITSFASASISKTALQDHSPLSLKCGRSELRLYPDGRVRILGDDVSIEALGRMGLKGAVVELN